MIEPEKVPKIEPANGSSLGKEGGEGGRGIRHCY